jgi:hypothetical protein
LVTNNPILTEVDMAQTSGQAKLIAPYVTTKPPPSLLSIMTEE